MLSKISLDSTIPFLNRNYIFLTDRKLIDENRIINNFTKMRILKLLFDPIFMGDMALN
jgi:hypothetical protein